MIYDILIIGAGPSGIYSAIYLQESGYKVAVSDHSMPGGKVNLAPRVDNFPGYKEILGPDLAFEFFNMMNENHIEFLPYKVNEIRKENDLFIISTSKGNYESRLVIVASGTDEKKLGLENEKELLGHGLSYCAICDGHFFKDKITMVVGEDKYALSEAIYLAGLAKEVIFVTSFDHIIGDKRKIDELATFNNVKYIYNSRITKLNGNPLNSVILNDKEEVKIDGLFPLLGYIPNTSFVSQDILNEDGFIKVDRNYESSIPGLFAIGDVIDRELKQIYLAVIDAKKVSEYIQNEFRRND